MPIPASIVAAGIGAAATGGQMIATGKLNKKGRKFTAEQNQLNRQMTWDMWNATNEWNLKNNSPLAQMQRYKEAGLNPHLIYGQGNEIDQGKLSVPNQDIPRDKDLDVHSFGQVAMNYVAMRKQQAEIDNLEKARQVMEADRLQKTAQTANTTIQTARSQFDLKQAEELKDTVIATANANLESKNIMIKKLEQEVTNTILDGKLKGRAINESDARTAKIRRETDAVAQSIAESAERVKNLRRQGKILQAEAELKRIEAEWMRNGTTKNDASWERKLWQLLDAFGISTDKIKSRFNILPNVR